MPTLDIDQLVQPDRVHRSVYTDPAIFELEMEHIWEKTWVYCGHESQVPKTGDYHTLHDRPPADDHGAPARTAACRCSTTAARTAACSWCGNHSGNTGSAFVCSYHAWSFHLDGKVRAIPLAKGYEGTRMNRDNPDCSMKRAARVDSYRGFVFASLGAEGPDLAGLPRRSARSPSTTCATARRSARSRWCRSATAWCSTRTGSSSWRTSSMRCTPR